MGGRSVMPLVHASRTAAARVGRGTAALRIPPPAAADVRAAFPRSPPRLFVHEGARQSLERKLRSAFPGAVILSITDNRHSIITHRVQRGVLHARVHHMFLDAPPQVLESLVSHVVGGDREASATLSEYIDANSARLARHARNAPRVTRGEHHDLLDIFQQVNERYFGGQVDALITWGKRGPARPLKTIKLGSYSAVDKLIRVHPALDRKWVPRYFVSYIVYHEMLHDVIPCSRGLGRANLHPPEFKQREKQFRCYQRALDWERRRIARLLRP